MSLPIPRKRFGQHFLHDQQVIQQIITAIAPQAGQHLVEIGPGTGALTIPLLKQINYLEVIELDRDLIQYLERHPAGQLKIYQADALRFDFKQLITERSQSLSKGNLSTEMIQQPLRIVGNLPYNIATPLLFHLLDYKEIIQDITVMLQKEVVDRMVAEPATADYGRLSVMLQYQCDIQPLLTVSPTAFRPPPKVDSSVVRLTPYPTPPVHVLNQQDFAQVVTQAFSQRRKTLRNTLKNILNMATLESIGIDPQARAETLTLTEFAQLANCLTVHKTTNSQTQDAKSVK